MDKRKSLNPRTKIINFRCTETMYNDLMKEAKRKGITLTAECINRLEKNSKGIQ